MMRVINTTAPWLVVGFFVVPPWLASIEPAENWLAVSGITVGDSDAGSPILMTVNRVIHRPFIANWVATVRRVVGDGVEVTCTATSTASYRPDAVLPRPVTLDWWTYPIQCVLPPGRYRLDTVWRIDAGGGVTKLVTAESNIFTIR